MGWIVGNEYTVPGNLNEFDGKRRIIYNLNEKKEKSPLWDLKLSDIHI